MNLFILQGPEATPNSSSTTLDPPRDEREVRPSPDQISSRPRRDSDADSNDADRKATLITSDNEDADDKIDPSEWRLHYKVIHYFEYSEIFVLKYIRGV